MRWTVEAIDTMTTMWSDGARARAIAEHLGTTKNSVLGQIFRAGLQRTTKTRKPFLARPRGDVGGSIIQSLKHRWKARPVFRGDGIVNTKPDHDRVGVDLMGLEFHHCRWPISADPQMSTFMYCGDPRVLGASYCPHHLKRSLKMWRVG